jgi:DinB superfamily
MIQVSVAPVASRSPHSRSPVMLDTATTSSLQVGVVRGHSSPQVSESVMEEPGARPLEWFSEHIARTASDLAAAVHAQPEAALVRRPVATSWAAKEIVCHLRDIEELFLLRLEAIAAMDEPMLPAAGMGARVLNLKPDGQAAAPERWAEDRQYLRNDVGEALAAFRRRREETLAHLAALAPEQWRRGGIHPRRGRLTVADLVSDLARHDDNHLDQLRRALHVASRRPA